MENRLSLKLKFLKTRKDMHKYFILLGLLFTTFCVKAQNADVLKVTQTLQEQTASWNKGDLEMFMQPYWQSDSLMFIGKTGITYGWQNTLANYKKGYPDMERMGILKFEILQVKQLEANYITMVGKWHLTRTVGNVEGHFSLLWKKIKGQWVIVMDHSS